MAQDARDALDIALTAIKHRMDMESLTKHEDSSPTRVNSAFDDWSLESSQVTPDKVHSLKQIVSMVMHICVRDSECSSDQIHCMLRPAERNLRISTLRTAVCPCDG